MSKLLSLKQYIVQEFIPEGRMEDISDDMDLIQNGILDSLAVLKLVAFVEDHYDIALEPEEIDPENLKSISAIAAMINEKCPS